MCFPGFLEKGAQFFRAAKSHLSDINIAADLVHQTMATLGNESRIGTPIIFRNIHVSLFGGERTSMLTFPPKKPARARKGTYATNICHQGGYLTKMPIE